MRPIRWCIVAAGLWSAPVAAQVDLASAQVCFDDAVAAGNDPAACIVTAQARCMVDSVEAPAVATLCLTTAQSVWSGALADAVQSALADADETTAAVARIELKYDLLGGLIQCDRLEELSIAGSNLTGPEIALQKAQCQSAASGLTYMRLYLQRITDAD